MKHNKLSLLFKKMRVGIILGLLLSGVLVSNAQTNERVHSNPNVRLGEKALLDGDFKAAANYLQKALPAESGDPSVMYMLGYSQYHSGEYKKALESFARVLKLRPDDSNAYYYRGKINNSLAVQSDTKISDTNRERMLNAAIDDYSKAIDLNAADVKLFQNRAIAYRDLGILIGTVGTDNYNKAAASKAYDKSISDFQQVLKMTPGKKDIETEIRKATVYRDNL